MSEFKFVSEDLIGCRKQPIEPSHSSKLTSGDAPFLESAGSSRHSLPTNAPSISILDRGHGTVALNNAAINMVDHLGVGHTLFVQRSSLSARFLYVYCLANLLIGGHATVIVPQRLKAAMGQDGQMPVSLLAHEVPGMVEKEWHGVVFSPEANQPDSTFLAEYLESLIESGLHNVSCSGSIVLLLESSAELHPRVVEALRSCMTNGTGTSLSVWMHCSLEQLPNDVLGQFVNVLAFLPTKSELRRLRENLPLSAPAIDEDENRFVGKLLAYGPCASDEQVKLKGQTRVGIRDFSF